MTSAQDVFGKVKAKEERVKIVFDPNLTDLHAELSEALDAAEDDAKRSIAEQIVALEDEIAEATVEFHVRGLGRARWRKLKADHAPSEEEAKQGMLYDEDFQFEATAESLIEPKISADDLRRLNELVTEMQWMELWSAVQFVNIGGGSIRPESLAARAILANGGGKSTQPSDSELAAVS